MFGSDIGYAVRCECRDCFMPTEEDVFNTLEAAEDCYLEQIEKAEFYSSVELVETNWTKRSETMLRSENL